MDARASESRFDEMKRYLRFDDDDVRALAALRIHAEPELARIAREFYERVREHEEAHAVFSHEAQIARLQTTLVSWMRRVLAGPFDHAYADAALALGRLHVRIGLPQRYLHGAMAIVRERLGDIADENLPDGGPLARRALGRVLDLETALMTEAYGDAAEERLRRTQRAAAHESEAAALALGATEHAPAMLIGLDGMGRVVLFNREAERVSGYHADEVMGTEVADGLLVDRNGAVHAQLAAALGGSQTEPTHVAVRAKSGRLRHVRLRLSPVQSAGGSLRAVAVGDDVTNERELELRVRQSEKLAAVGTLAAGLAHEIRNPLNGALLHLTFLERELGEGKVTADALEAVHVVASEIRRLGNLVGDFLDFARPRALNLEQSSIQKLCEKSVALVGAAAARAGLALRLECPDTEIRAEIDSAMIEQVLLNLLQNGIEASADGAGTTVRLRAYREPRWVVIEVNDDGPGLPSADAPIFDAFYSSKPSGTGLGLAIVHRIVTDHRGSVDATSHPGATTFRVKLPLAQPPRERSSEEGT